MEYKKTRSTWFQLWLQILSLGSVIAIFNIFFKFSGSELSVVVPHDLRGPVAIIGLIALYGIWKWKKWGIWLFVAGQALGLIGNLLFSPANGTNLSFNLLFIVVEDFLFYKYLIQPNWKLFDGKSTTSEKVIPVVKDPRAKRRDTAIIVGILLFVMGIGFASTFNTGYTNLPKVEKTLSTFMSDMSTNDVDGAYSLFSSSFQQANPKEKLIESLPHARQDLTDFSSLEEKGFKVRSTTDGVNVYEYSGLVHYTDGTTGRLEATLIQESNAWRIQAISVDANLDRASKFIPVPVASPQLK